MALQPYIDAWADSMSAIAGLGIDEAQGGLETCLPDWRVRDILAHLVHLEEVLAFGRSGAAQTEAGGAAAPPLTGAVTSDYTQPGVEQLADVPVAQLLERLATAAAARAAQLDPPPADPAAPADRAPGGIDWNWDTLLRNRAIDAWMHEQDIRRAIGSPGGLDSAGAAVTVRSFASALPFVVGKRARAPQGHGVRFDIAGPIAFSRTIAVGENGRAADTDDEPRTVIAMDSETFARLGGGRESAEEFDVRVTGDAELASRVLSSLAVTP